MVKLHCKAALGGYHNSAACSCMSCFLQTDMHLHTDAAITATTCTHTTKTLEYGRAHLGPLGVAGAGVGGQQRIAAHAVGGHAQRPAQADGDAGWHLRHILQ